MDFKQLSRLLLVTPLLRAVVAIHTVPAGAPWRRACDNCGAPLRVGRRSRVFSPVGRCGVCQERIGAPPFLLEAATVVAVALVVVPAALGRLSIVESFAVAWWAGWTIPLAFIDAAVHRLPDRLTYAAAAGTVGVLTLATVGQHDLRQLARALIAGLATAAIFAVLTVVLGRAGPGLGDAKLMLSTATLLGWFGWWTLAVGITLGVVAQGVLAAGVVVAGRAKQVTHVPMGPFLVGGAAIAITVSS